MPKSFEINQKRVVGFIGHAGAGKTSLCEAILFNAKANERIGSVDAGQAMMDFEPEEQKRRYSVSTTFFDVEHKGNLIYLVDTPGNSNFIPESLSLLPSLGAVVLPVDAVEGVKYQTELVSEDLKKLKMPHVAVITRIDKEHSDFDKAYTSLTEKFDVEPVLLQLPIGKEEDFNGVVDLLSNKAYTYPDTSGKPTIGDIPDDLKDQADELRNTMIERLVESDDEVMMKYLDGEEVSEEELIGCLKKGTIGAQFCPVLIGSGTKNIGIDILLDFIIQAFPNPLEERERPILDATSEEESTFTISEEGAFAAQVIKTLSDPFAGKVSIMRVYRGSMSADEMFFNINHRSKEKPGKFYHQRSKEQVQVERATAGDVIAVIKLKNLNTGDTMASAESDNIKFPALPIMQPMVHYTVHPKTTGEEEKMTVAITKILEEDANLRFWRQDQTSEFILSGVGQSQIDVAMERMKRKFNVEVLLTTPKVPYRETIKGKAEVQGKYKKQSGGRGQYGDCHIRVEPLPRSGGFEFIDSIVGGVIPKQFIPAVEKGIVEAMVKGDLTGNPVQDVKVELFFGSYHTVDSSEMAFKMAGSMAWKKAMLDAKPILLEPIHKVTIKVPSEFMGDVYGNISSRRGKVQGSDDLGKLTEIYAEMPEAEMHTLSTDIRSMTGDRGVFVANFDHYEEVPPAISEKLVEDFKKEKEEG